MSIDTTKTAFGFALTCTGGTAAATVVSGAELGKRIRVSGIICGGAATTDITTVTDANGVVIFVGAGTISVPFQTSWASPVSFDGLKVGIAGATTGYCNIFVDK